MAYISSTSTLAPAVQAFYDKRFMLRAQAELAGYQFGQKRQMPGGVGKTVYFTRYMPMSKVTTALTEALTGGLDPATRPALQTEEISVAVALWGDYTQITKIAKITSIDRNVSQAVDVMSQQAGESIDARILQVAMGPYLLRRRADADATYQIEGTAASGSTTTLVTADSATGGSTQATGVFNGGFLTITAGTNYGQTRQIVTSVQSGTYVQTLTVAAFPKAIDTTSKYRFTVGTGIVATDVLTTANLRLAMRDLKRGKAIKAEKGYFVGLINPDLEYDFMGDTTWVAAAQYKDSVDSLYTGEIGKWLGTRFVGASQLLRESVAGVAAEDAAVHVAAILGKECYGVVELEGQEKKIYVKTPDQLGQPIPIYGTCGWQVGFEGKMLNSCFGVGLMCGASA